MEKYTSIKNVEVTPTKTIIPNPSIYSKVKQSNLSLIASQVKIKKYGQKKKKTGQKHCHDALTT